MSNKTGKIKSAAGKVGDFLNNVSSIFDSNDPIIVLPYRGYANKNRFFLKGRVLENEDIFRGKSDSQLRNLINSFKRFETDEIAAADVSINIGGHSFSAITDEEGYYSLDCEWPSPVQLPKANVLSAEVTLPAIKGTLGKTIKGKSAIHFASGNADYGIISDVDDTVLQTHITSRFKLKMLYATFLQDAHQRKPIEGMVQAFRAFERGGDGTRTNPIFYVSHSPWNIYDLLEQFLEIQEFPRGPILLRDFGLNPVGNYADHKIKSISHILRMHPKLPFILFGDAAEKDTDFYLQLARSFPNQIRAIYIRKNRQNKNARRIAALVEDQSAVNILLYNSSQELFDHARKHKFLL